MVSKNTWLLRRRWGSTAAKVVANRRGAYGEIASSRRKGVTTESFERNLKIG
jgi:hypothetical protein